MTTSLIEENRPGLLMVKPHALELGLDHVVEGLLTPGSYASKVISDDDPLKRYVNNIQLGTPIVRDLSRLPKGKKLIELFYADKVTRRYYPLILEQYVGNVILLPYNEANLDSDSSKVSDAIKGETLVLDHEGNAINRPTGIRGIIGQTYEYFTNQEAELLDDASYRHYFMPVVNNYVHVCDSKCQVSAAMQLLLDV